MPGLSCVRTAQGSFFVRRWLLPLIVLAITTTTNSSFGSPTQLNADRNNDLGAFGDTYTFHVDQGGSYSGFSSQVVGEIGNTGSPKFGSTAVILMGKASSATDVTMSWRTRTASETTGTATVPPMHDSPPYGGVLSDVLSLQGMAPAPGGVHISDDRYQTDVYALQVNYNDAAVVAAYDYGVTAGLSDQQIADTWGSLYLGWLNPGNDNTIGRPTADADDVWENAVDGNFGHGTTVITNYRGLADGSGDLSRGSWTNFVAQYNVTENNLSNFLGCWGIDTDNNQMWAVINHNSQFAAIPEPGSAALLCIGALGLLRRRRK